MKKLIDFFLLNWYLIAAVILAIFLFTTELSFAEGQVVDPTATPTYTITCVDPITREDETQLAIGEIATRNFFVSATSEGALKSWEPAGSNNAECRQVYNLADVPDGQYYYTVSAVDDAGRESILAYDNVDAPIQDRYVAVVVKRIANPRSPTGLAGSAS